MGFSVRHPLVYYKLFDEGELSQVRNPVSSDNPYIGRVDTSRIPPPHTVISLVERICKQEGKGFGFDWDKNDAFETILFRTISAPEAFRLQDTLELLSEQRPGSSPLEPVILKTAYHGALIKISLNILMPNYSYQTFVMFLTCDLNSSRVILSDLPSVERANPIALFLATVSLAAHHFIYNPSW